MTTILGLIAMAMGATGLAVLLISAWIDMKAKEMARGVTEARTAFATPVAKEPRRTWSN